MAKGRKKVIPPTPENTDVFRTFEEKTITSEPELREMIGEKLKDVQTLTKQLVEVKENTSSPKLDAPTESQIRATIGEKLKEVQYLTKELVEVQKREKTADRNRFLMMERALNRLMIFIKF
jgi:hypothetical protein